MAPKEDMLPPGWEDLDRYVDLLFRECYSPRPSLPYFCPSPRVVEPKQTPTPYFIYRTI